MILTFLPWLLFGFTLCAAAPLGWRCIRLSRARAVAEATCEAAREGEATVTRSLQLLAHELQALALTLRGHADQLSAESHAHAPIVAAIVAQLCGLADELGHHLIPAGPPRVLDCETIEIAAVVSEAVEAMVSAIHPGRRHWRVVGGRAMLLWADHRALRLVLIRVLGEAVRSSGHDDWIEIGWQDGPEGLTLRVEDEGAGTSVPDPCLPAGGGPALDSRGIGLRLSLARALTQAHGGTLEVEALARVGTRVTIVLPAERLRPTPSLGTGAANAIPYSVA